MTYTQGVSLPLRFCLHVNHFSGTTLPYHPEMYFTNPLGIS
jgi:hypothetical protein